MSATLLRQTGGAVGGATITFRVDGAPVGTAVTNASGVATLSTYDPSTLNAGPHSVLATFPGETIGGTTFVGSTSNTQTLTVNKRGTQTTISSSLNPSTFGESVTFTATVVGTGAGAASVNTSSLNAGNHTVEAFFTSADTNFNDSNDALDGGQSTNATH